MLLKTFIFLLIIALVLLGMFYPIKTISTFTYYYSFDFYPTDKNQFGIYYMPDYMEIRTDYFLLTDSSSAIIRTEASSVPIDFNKFRLRYYDSTKCYIDKNIQKLVINDAGSVLILFDKLDKKEWIKVDSSIYDFTKSIDNSFKIKRKYKI